MSISGLNKDLICLGMPTQFFELKQYNVETVSIRPPLNLFIVTYKLMGTGLTFVAIHKSLPVLTFLASLLGTKLKIFPGIEIQILLVLKVHQNLVH
jgi:hypothetical protein